MVTTKVDIGVMGARSSVMEKLSLEAQAAASEPQRVIPAMVPGACNRPADMNLLN